VLKQFLWDILSMVELTENAREILLVGGDLMSRLVGDPDCLPPQFSAPGAERARSYLLFADMMERFSPMSLVLAPGQATPIAEENFWRIAGVARGAVLRRRFDLDAEGRPVLRAHGEKSLERGAVETSPAGGFAQWVNADPHKEALLVLAYGGEPAKTPRRVFDDEGRECLAPLPCDNSDDAPPYDIWTIQKRVED
jgi:predicted metal-dependent enzyme (double-stranded beta helix superfamily)